jgi:hypothetical protein
MFVHEPVERRAGGIFMAYTEEHMQHARDVTGTAFTKAFLMLARSAMPTMSKIIAVSACP